METDLSEYTIRLAKPTQEEEHWRASFVPWNRDLNWKTFREYQVRSKSEGDWTSDGAFRCWVLVRRDDIEGSIYCGCETFRRKSLLAEPGRGDVQEVFSYSITSLVTPVEYQRKGFATHLSRLLHYHLGPPSLTPFPTNHWGSPPPPLSPSDRAHFPPGIASILFSDVGSTFYERAAIDVDRPGWDVDRADCRQLSWKLLSPRQAERGHRWTWIYTPDLPSFSRELSSGAQRKLLTAAKTSLVPLWCLDPASPGTLAYLPSTADWYRPPGVASNMDPAPCGIRISSPEQEDTIVIFCGAHEFIGQALLVTYIHNLDPRRLPILLEALDEVGAQLGVKEGYIWGLSAGNELEAAWMGMEGRGARCGKRGEDLGHLLGVAWYGTGAPEQKGRMVDTQIWNWT